MKDFRILNLGAGRQSTALYEMDRCGELGERRFDYAIFADTQEEPDSVYEHIEFLRSRPGGAPILTGTEGKLGDDLTRLIPQGKSRIRFSSIPAFTKSPDGEVGITRRQCTSDYKIKVVDRIIRRQILGLRPKQHIPSDVHITQVFGLSFDEPGRCEDTKARVEKHRNFTAEFPLYDRTITTAQCVDYLLDRGILVRRSACVFCPYKSNKEWRDLQVGDTKAWNRAVEIDELLRTPGVAANYGLESELYLHRSCRPLRLIDFSQEDDQNMLWGFMNECHGMCGS